jgi:low temperature requirement protein LtrA
MQIPRLSPPRLRTSQHEDHRSATWLELFYDLVFVVAVGRLGHRLLVNHGVGGTWGFIALFIPLWWTWASYTFYADRYDTDDLGQRLLAVVQMASIAIMAASISGDEADSVTAFAAAFVLARIVLLTMYWRAFRHVVESRDLVRGYLSGFSVGGAFWLVSIWVPDPARFVFWAIGLVIDFYTPFHLRERQKRIPLSVSHLPERFGLFTILVLGESFVAIVAALSHHEWDLSYTIAAIVGVGLATSLWWLYFDNQKGDVVRRSDTGKAWKPTGWIYAHLPLVVSITVVGIGLEFLIAQESHGPGRWMVAGGGAVVMLALALMSIAANRGHDALDRRQAASRVAAAGALLVIALISDGWSPNAILIAVLLVNAVEIGDDIRLGLGRSQAD